MTDLIDKETEDALLAAVSFKPTLHHTAVKHVSSADFTDVVSGSIYKAVGDLHSQGVVPDIMTIKDAATHMMAHSSLIHDPDELVADHIDYLKSKRFTPENVERYAKKIRRLSLLRMVDGSIHRIVSQITNEANPEQLAAKAMEELLHLTSAGTENMSMHYSELHDAYISDLVREAELLQQTGELPGIRFDFKAIDEYSNGIRDEELMILAGDPGAGKTSVAMALLRRFAFRESKKEDRAQGALFVSLEMGQHATAMRWAQMIGEMTSKDLRSTPSMDKIGTLSQKWTAEKDIPLWIMFGGAMKSDELKARIAYMVRKHNIKLVVIDHFKRVRVDGRHHSDNSMDEARIKYINEEICQSLKVAVILIAHTSKASSGRDDKKPRMSDLSGSQYIAAEADSIVFVYRPYESLTDAEKHDPNCPYRSSDAYLVWRKNRNDTTGDAPFVFEGSTMRIEDVVPIPMTFKVLDDPQQLLEYGVTEPLQDRVVTDQLHGKRVLGSTHHDSEEVY